VDPVRLRNHRSAGGVEAGVVHRLLSSLTMWLPIDSHGLHASWYERVQNTAGGADLLRRDGETLSLATPTTAPAGSEFTLSTVDFPIYQTNPNQDAVIAACYMGDYDEVASNGTTRFAPWGDNRNVVTTSGGVTENQADVFLQSF